MTVTVDLPEAFKGLLSPARYKAYYGGRGGGKSHAFATALLLEAGRGPLRVLCAREVQNSIKDSVKQLLDDKIAALGMGDFFVSTQTDIRGRNGSNFIFAGLGKLTTDQVKSMEGINRAWVEEAQTISANSLKILIPTIREPGSEIWFSWNPRNASDPVDARFRGEAPPKDSVIRRVNYDENAFFPSVLDDERAYDEISNREHYGNVWLGEYEVVAVGAIWDRLMLHQGRRSDKPDMARIVVSVDPAISSEDGSNEHGITVQGIGEDGRGYVLDDQSLHGSPRQWAERAVAAYDLWEADAVVVEINQGGDMVEHTLRSVRPGLKVIKVRATRGKHVRAEPIAALYSLGRISHVGTFPRLEDQMCLMTAGGYEGEGSPDRVDAMVWGFTELFPRLTKKKRRRRMPDRANSDYDIHAY